MTIATRINTDFDFLTGDFDVVHRQLKNPLTGSTEWVESVGTCTARTALDGAVSIDEMQFPANGTYGMSLRLYDRAAQEWAIYWVNSRTGQLQPPVRGRWENGVAWLVGEDTHEGRPILASYRWSDVTEQTARWEQGFSVDGGVTWELNWVMEFTRRAEPVPRLDIPKVTGDFDFLQGDLTMAHRKLDAPLTGSETWSEMQTTLHAWTHFDGMVSIDEAVFSTPTGGGLTVRLFDKVAGEWSLYWITRRDVVLTPPQVGTFGADGVGIFDAREEIGGREVVVRYRWTRGEVPMWEQLFSVDDGRTWERNWVATFTR